MSLHRGFASLVAIVSLIAALAVRLLADGAAIAGGLVGVIAVLGVIALARLVASVERARRRQ